MPRKFTDPRRAAVFAAEIWQNACLVWRLLRDRRVPLGPKAIVPATFLYLVFPIDIIPDILPGLGQLDDLAIILVGLKLFLDLCPHHLVREHQENMVSDEERNWDSGRPESRSANTIDGIYRVMDDGRSGASPQ